MDVPEQNEHDNLEQGEHNNFSFHLDCGLVTLSQSELRERFPRLVDERLKEFKSADFYRIRFVILKCHVL